MSAGLVHESVKGLLQELLLEHSKVMVHLVSGDMARLHGELLRGLEVVEAHSAMNKKAWYRVERSWQAFIASFYSHSHHMASGPLSI